MHSATKALRELGHAEFYEPNSKGGENIMKLLSTAYVLGVSTAFRKLMAILITSHHNGRIISIPKFPVAGERVRLRGLE